jgi:hypothetical protein
MNWTYEEAVQHQIRHGFMADPAGATGTIGPSHSDQHAMVARKLRRSRAPNKTEAEFGRMLEARRHKGEFLTVEFEALKLKVGDGTYYTPDWFCHTLFARPAIFEVKGKHRWDDAIVKYKAAKERYTWADFEMWEKSSDGWRLIG